MRLKISKIDIRFGYYPLQKPFRISSGLIREVPQIFVEVGIVYGKRLVKGLGHNSIGLLWADRRELPVEEKEREFRESVKQMAGKFLGFSFSTPFDFYEKFAFKNGTKLPNLAYVMALSPIDLALWDAYAKLRGKNIFALPEVISYMDYDKPQEVQAVHLIGIDDPIYSITCAIKKEGISHFKIKLSGKPDTDAKRANRIAGIKRVAKLTVDANEAYGSLEDLRNFVGLLDSMALRKLLFIEQPFLRNSKVSVRRAGIKIPLFADESYAHHRDIKKLYELGYKGVALKPHTKTFSGTLLALDELRKRNMLYSVMDLTTAPPVGYLVGAMSAAMLNTIGGVELNGRQHYQNWASLVSLGFQMRQLAFLIRDGVCDVSNFFEKPGWGVNRAAYSKYVKLYA